MLSENSRTVNAKDEVTEVEPATHTKEIFCVQGTQNLSPGDHDEARGGEAPAQTPRAAQTPPSLTWSGRYRPGGSQGDLVHPEQLLPTVATGQAGAHLGVGGQGLLHIGLLLLSWRSRVTPPE